MADSTVKLLWKTDRASLSETLRANNQIERSLDRVGDEGEYSLDTVTRASNEATSALRATERQASDTADSVDRLRQASERFDETSKQVSLAGDVQSNLGAASGLAGAAGLGGASQAIGLAGEFSALVEEAPRLKEALGGMPDTIKAAASAIGASGVGLIGALGALAIAAKFAADAYRNEMASANTLIDARLRLIELQKTGTAEELELERQSAQQQLDLAKAQLPILQSIREQTLAALDPLHKGAALLGNLVGLGAGGEIGALDNQISDLQATIAASETLIKGIGNSTGITEKAVEAEDKLAEARANVARQNADIIKEGEITRYQRIGNQRRTAPQAATARDDSAQRNADQARKDAEQRAKQLRDIQKKTQEQLADLQTKFARDEEQARIDMYDKLEDIRRKAEVEEGKAAEQRDFLQLADARDAAKDEARAVERENERAARDRLRELQYANTDVMLEQRRALQDLQQSNRQQVMAVKAGATASLNIMTNWAKAFERIFSGVPLPGGGGGARSSSSGLQDLAAVL